MPESDNEPVGTAAVEQPTEQPTEPSRTAPHTHEPPAHEGHDSTSSTETTDLVEQSTTDTRAISNAETAEFVLPSAWETLRTLAIPAIGDEGRQRDITVALVTETPGRPDSIIDGGRYGPVEVRAASVRGLSHRAKNRPKPRQDDYCIHHSQDGRWLVVVVSDGVSSASLSHIAATMVARKGADLIVERLATTEPCDINWEEVGSLLSGHLVLEARRRFIGDDVAREAIGAKEAGISLAATAVVVLIDTHRINDDGSLSGHLVNVAGDSSVWMLNQRTWTPLTGGKHEDGVEHGVKALPAGGAITQHGICIPAGAAVTVMTDGLGDPLSIAPEVRFTLAQVWSSPPDQFTFALELSFLRRTFDDDRTAVMIWNPV